MMKSLYTIVFISLFSGSLFSQVLTGTSGSDYVEGAMSGQVSKYVDINVPGVSELRLSAFVTAFEYGVAQLIVFSPSWQTLNQITVSGPGPGGQSNSDEQVFIVPSECKIYLLAVDQGSAAAFSYNAIYTTPGAQITNHSISTADSPVSLEHNILFNAKDKYTVSASGSASVDEDKLFDGILSNVAITGGSVSSANPYVITVDNLPNIEPEGKSYIGFLSAADPPSSFIIEGNTSAGWQTFAYSDNNISKDYFVEVDNSCTKFSIRVFDVPNTTTNIGIAEIVFIQSTAAIPYDGLYLKSEQQDLNVSGAIYQPTETGIKISNLSNKTVFKASTTQTEIHAAGSGGTVIKSDGDDALVTIDDDGYMGVGTSSPEGLLHVGDNTGSGVIFSNRISTFSPMKGAQISWAESNLEGGTEGDLIIAPSTDVNTSSIRFFTNNGTTVGERVRIDESGNVGIGTNSPGAALAVNGTILAHEVAITTNVTSYPDFVFTDDYKLMSLEDLKQFIEKYGHLPEIPTATEASQNGIKLAEMNKKLLQKVEELTLHLIEANQRMVEMNGRLIQLEKENSCIK